jgi:hypothetical protein
MKLKALVVMTFAIALIVLAWFFTGAPKDPNAPCVWDGTPPMPACAANCPGYPQTNPFLQCTISGKSGIPCCCPKGFQACPVKNSTGVAVSTTCVKGDACPP